MDGLLHLQVDERLAVAESDAKSQVVAESDANPVSLVAHPEVPVAMVVALACLLLVLASPVLVSACLLLVLAVLVELVVVATAESVA